MIEHSKNVSASRSRSLLATLHFLLLCYLFTVLPVGAELPSKVSSEINPIRISFINPAFQGEVFWDKLTNLMRAEANARDIELQVHYSGGNRMQVLSLVSSIIKQVPKPDYLIFVFQSHIGEPLLQQTEAAGIQSFSINTNIPADEQTNIGLPREKFRLWLGHMYPDEQSAGYTLAQSLVEQARAASGPESSGAVTMLALAGSHDSAASSERLEGLNVFLNAQPNVTLAQVVKASWKEDKAREMTDVLLRRYPSTRIIWAASDLMALGAVAAAENQGRVPGKTLFAGGIDGTAAGLAALSQGRLQATLTGHYQEGARALVLLHAHYHGQDFADSLGTRIRTQLTLINAENVAAYLNGTESVDAKQ